MASYPLPVLTRRQALVRLAGIGAAAALAPGLLRAQGGAARKKVLFFSKSSGFEHSVIKTPAGGGPSLAEQVLAELGAAHRVDFTFSKDGSLFTPGYLAGFDGYMFFTTGDLTTAGTDQHPPMTPAGKQALLDAIHGGKGFVGLHAATDTFHGKDQEVDPYIAMIGGEFMKHGAQQPSTSKIVDPKFPGLRGLGDSFRISEEWYSLKNLASDLHVLLVQETAGMAGVPYQRPNYPSTWIRKHGQGRVFYTSMGHRDDVWHSDRYHAMLTGGLDWTLGRADADATPNVAQVTPEYRALPA